MRLHRSLALSCLLAAAVWRVSGVPQALTAAPTRVTSAVYPSTASAFTRSNSSSERDEATGTRVSSVMTHLPTLKNMVIVICVLTAALITGLFIRVLRSGRRLRKTRKYDIITTPAERVEMAPLNEGDDDEEDSTLFDVKYR